MKLIVLLYGMAGLCAGYAQAVDQRCAACHRSIVEAYQKTSMAGASGTALDGFIAGSFLHRASGVQYTIERRKNEVWLTYERPGAPAAPLRGERRLEYFVGSGHRGRTYLFEQEKLWFEAPINYYGKRGLWDMAPGYTRALNMPLTLPVDANCLHCHASGVGWTNGGVRNRFAGAPFAAGGIGCDACHGDPASHLAAEAEHTGVGKIVNPAKLPAARRDSACLQCHLEGVAAIYKAGHSLATYKPGDDLAESVVHFVDTSRPNFGNRASSQYEALLRSACRRAVGDKLTCTSCHDPHSTPAPEKRVAFYRQKCLSCHSGVSMEREHHPEQQDCAVCHMPTRDTADISHEQLTDHDIERLPKRGDLQLRSLDEGSSRQAVQLAAVGSFTFSDRESGLAYAQMARKGDRTAGERAMNLLQKAESAGYADATVHIQLGWLRQMAGDRAAAAKEYEAALAEEPEDTVAMTNAAVLAAASGQSLRAVTLLKRVMELDPSQTSAGLDLAFLQCSLRQPVESRATLDRILKLDPDNPQVRRFVAAGEFAGSRCRLP